MKGKKQKLSLLCVAVLLFGCTGAARGDWDEGDPHKMHYPQLPKEGGWDVALFSSEAGSIWLADDWQCSQTGPVSDIHFWVSWKDDMVQTINGFSVRIWSDDPCGPEGYSEPNELLCEREFYAGDFTVRYMPDDLQGWFDPYWYEWDPCDHTQWAQVNITDINFTDINDANKPFIQEEGKVYWLMIDMWGGGEIGWKQSGSPHFRDDAVYYDGLYWIELRDPITYESLDLAFVITTEEGEPDIKWEQLPDPYFCGLHAHDYDLGYGYERLILADDWLCEGGVVTDFHWWGAIEALGSDLMGFHLSIHANDDPCCLPADPALWEADIPIGSITATPTGVFNSCGEEIIKYEYFLSPTEYFYQELGNTYWFDICALSNDPCNPCLWHWQEAGRNPVSILCPAAYKTWPVPDTWSSIDWDPNYSDMAFVITSKEEEPNQPTVKWVQNPDLSQTGLDVDASGDLMGTGPWPDQILADDFNCIATGPITDIRIWGSLYHDELPCGEPNNLDFTLSIHADLPVGDPCNPFDYSIPGEILWVRDFLSEDFNVSIEANELMEGYYVPCEPYYEPDADWTCWRYDFSIDPCDAFIQQGDPCNPVIYWLDVQVLTDEMTCPARFGWKTSLDHWNDDAVWAQGDEWDHSQWQELRYPQGHPFEGDSIDLAFAINSGEEPCEPNYAKPLMPHTKWSQPPVEIDPYSPVPTYCGWDEDSDNIDIWRIVADDFRCLGTMPITSIHWWGSYIYWEGNEPPLVNPDAWQIGFWSNIQPPPDADPNYSYPNVLLHSIMIPADRVDFEKVGSDEYYGYYPYDICYQYSVELEPNEVFWQDDYNDVTEDSIFWMSIIAIYPNDVSVDFLWGWKTRPWHWMDDAVVFPHFGPGPLVPGMTVDPCFVEPIEDPMWGESFDMAFELDTDPDYIKWEQLYTGIRHWPHYEDEKSMDDVNAPEDLRGVADDWWCLRRTPVTAIVWWGSYIGYGYEACSQGPFMPLPVPPDFFVLTVWTDSPAGSDPCYSFSHPNEPIWEYWAYDYDEVLVGYDKHPHDGGDGNGVCVVVPNACATVEGDNENSWPFNLSYFGAQSQRYQQIYDETEVGQTGTITQVRFRPDSLYGNPFGPSNMNVNIYLGYSSNPVSSPSENFANNIGPSYTLVYSGVLTLSSADTGGPPSNFDIVVDVDDIFTYDPNIGPLLLDVYMYTSSSTTFFDADGLDSGQTGTTRIYSRREGSVTDPCGIIHYGGPADPLFGLVTMFCFDGATPPMIPATSSISGVPVANRGPYEPDGMTGAIKSSNSNVPKDRETPGRAMVEFANPEKTSSIGHEPVFRYSVRLPEDEWFHQPDYNEVFWLSVLAVYEVNVPNYEWGWTNHEHVFNDDAVAIYVDANSGEFSWEELYDQTGKSEDMSFILFTDPDECVDCADYNTDYIINFFDYADFADDWRWTGPAGGYNNSDLNCDGIVDFKDLGIFCMQWLDSCP